MSKNIRWLKKLINEFKLGTVMPGNQNQLIGDIIFTQEVLDFQTPSASTYGNISAVIDMPFGFNYSVYIRII